MNYEKKRDVNRLQGTEREIYETVMDKKEFDGNISAVLGSQFEQLIREYVQDSGKYNIEVCKWKKSNETLPEIFKVADLIITDKKSGFKYYLQCKYRRNDPILDLSDEFSKLEKICPSAKYAYNSFPIYYIWGFGGKTYDPEDIYIATPKQLTQLAEKDPFLIIEGFSIGDLKDFKVKSGKDLVSIIESGYK